MTRLTLEWPGWVWRCWIGRMRIRVYPTGLLALCFLQFLLGLMLLWMLPMWVAILTPVPIAQATLDAVLFDWRGAVIYVPFAVLSTVVHELGHVVGARIAGVPVKSFVLGSHGRIYSEPPTTTQGQLLLKASGPLTALAYGVVLLTAAPITTPVAAAGVWAVTAALINMLPLPPANSDGAATWRAARILLTQPRHEPAPHRIPRIGLQRAPLRRHRPGVGVRSNLKTVCRHTETRCRRPA